MNPIEEFEKLGEHEVRKRLANNVYGAPRNPNYLSAQAWLRSKERESEEARNEEILSVAKEANAVAREANDLALASNTIASEAKEFARLASISASKQARWAMWAAIIATVAIIIAVMTYIKPP
jgi:hypothetical protein